jgi:hypothetical protein
MANVDSKRQALSVHQRIPPRHAGTYPTDRIEAPPSVGDSMTSCPRAGCHNRACPVRRGGCGNGAIVRQLRHRQTKGAATVAPNPSSPRHVPLYQIKAPCVLHVVSIVFFSSPRICEYSPASRPRSSDYLLEARQNLRHFFAQHSIQGLLGFLRNALGLEVIPSRFSKTASGA